jgi:hypothetical protein
MSRSHVDHSNLVRFADEKVNLPKDKANEYRAQVRGLREKLEGYLTGIAVAATPDDERKFELEGVG